MRTKHPIRKTIYVGIDNGVTGTIGGTNGNGSRHWFYETPVHLEQDFTKKKQNLNRLDVEEFRRIIEIIASHGTPRFFLERPMINGMRFRASLSAARCLEATLVSLALVGNFRYEYIDSKKWQDLLLPKGTKGTVALKKASVDIGVRLFPAHAALIKRHKDADGLLIAEAMRRMER